MMKFDKDFFKYVIGNVIFNFFYVCDFVYYIIGIYIYIMMFYFIFVEMLEFRLV